MKLFVATKATQGRRASDFCWVPEDELVGFAFECDRDNDNPDGNCGCKRSMCGLISRTGTTTFKVVDLPLTRSDLICKIQDSLVKSGWGNAGAEIASIGREDADELIRLANTFDVGDILEKRGAIIRKRGTVMTPQTKSLDRIHDKYYGKNKAHLTPAEAGKKFNKVSPAQKVIPVAKTLDKHPSKDGKDSRKHLMEQAKAAGIKYFRIMNKEELDRVLNLHVDGNHTEIVKIQAVANARWKSGWSKKGVSDATS